MKIIWIFLSFILLQVGGSLGLDNNEEGSELPQHLGAAPRYRDSNFFSYAGYQVFGRADCGTGCPTGEKCCNSSEGAAYCVPEGATCCGRGWCNDLLEICCLDGPVGACCPRESECAIGGKGCCIKGRPCFGPYICYDHQSIECKSGTIEGFQCCPPATPWCLFDPKNGYGCFVENNLPTYTNIISTPTKLVKVSSTIPDSEVPSSLTTLISSGTGVTLTNIESVPGNNGTITEATTTTPQSTGASSSSLPTSSHSSSGGSDPKSNSTSRATSKTSYIVEASTTTRRTTTSTNVPTTTTDEVNGSVPTGSGLFMQVGAVGLALMMLT